jgi:uncharacterized OsmC-like protein
MSSPIRDAIRAATAYLTEHPEQARYTDSAATAVLTSGLAVTVHSADGFSFATDMPTSVGGSANAPSLGWILRAAQASCLATLIAMRAASEGLAVTRVEVAVESESDDRGILGMDDSVPAGPYSSRARAYVEAVGATHAQIEAIVHWADMHCPVQDAVRRAVLMHLEVISGAD